MYSRQIAPFSDSSRYRESRRQGCKSLDMPIACFDMVNSKFSYGRSEGKEKVPGTVSGGIIGLLGASMSSRVGMRKCRDDANSLGCPCVS